MTRARSNACAKFGVFARQKNIYFSVLGVLTRGGTLLYAYIVAGGDRLAGWTDFSKEVGAMAMDIVLYVAGCLSLDSNKEKEDENI